MTLQENDLEVMEANGINTDHLNLQHTSPEDTVIEDEGYNQNDQDREAKVAIAALGNEQSAEADRYTAIKNLATFAIGLL